MTTDDLLSAIGAHARGIRDILIISSPEYMDNYQRLFGDGSAFGLSITYAEQPRPEGLAQAFTIGADFIGDDNVALVLGDNIFFGANLTDLLASAVARKNGATVFSYRVEDPERYGVVELSEDAEPSPWKKSLRSRNPTMPLRASISTTTVLWTWPAI